MPINLPKRAHAHPWVGLSPLTAKCHQLDSVSIECHCGGSDDVAGPASPLGAMYRQRGGSDGKDDCEATASHLVPITSFASPPPPPSPPCPLGATYHRRGDSNGEDNGDGNREDNCEVAVSLPAPITSFVSAPPPPLSPPRPCLEDSFKLSVMPTVSWPFSILMT